MGRRSKKSHKSHKSKQPQSGAGKHGASENIAYYFLAAIGLVLVGLVVATILGYLGII